MKTTLLITTYNRAEQLNNSLNRLTHLTLPDEVLIVDDGSTDETEKTVSSYNDRLPIKYIYNHNPDWTICSFARNIGIKNAIGDLIITSEPEMLWVTDLIPIILEERIKYPNQLISASIIYHQQPATDFNPGLIADPVSALKDEIVEDYEIQPRSYHPSGYVKTKDMQATFIASYEKKWLMDIGGWDEGFEGCWGWDDIDLATRLRVNGINQHICRKLHAIHQKHEKPPQHLWMKGSQINEKRFKMKDLQDKDNPNIVANRDKEWGVIKTR